MKVDNSEVCLLYSESDKVIAAKLESALNYYSIDIWKSQNISIGGNIITETDKVLQKAKFIIVLWSNTSIKSALLKDLASEAKKNKKVLIPVLIEKVEIPGNFLDIQPANLVGWDGDKENEQIVKLWRLIQETVFKYRQKNLVFNQIIPIIGLILTAMGVLFTITTPEVRCLLKLQCQENLSTENSLKPQETLTQSPATTTEITPSPNPKTEITPSPTPTPQVTPSPTPTTAIAPKTTPVTVSQPINKTSQQTSLKAQSLDEDNKLKFESGGCYRNNGTTVVCGVLVTNLSNTRQDVLFSGNANIPWITNAIDTSGTVYGTKLAQSGTQESSTSYSFYFSTNIASRIPTKIIFTFEIPKEVTQLSALDVGYSVTDQSHGKRIAISNIGVILNN